MTLSGVLAVIPARLGATRLPRKPLALLGGVPLVVRTARAVRAARVADSLWIVTDSAEVEDVAAAAGFTVRRVDTPCRSGTERVARAVVEAGAEPELVLNVQADEPFVAADLLAPLVAAIGAGAGIATLAAPLKPAGRGDPHRVKVVCDARGRALYFSRAPIPGDLHLGLYAFRGALLPRLPDLPRSTLAEAEGLEQLDWLHAGLSIAVAMAPRATLSIDTPEDLAAAERLLSEAKTP